MPGIAANESSEIVSQLQEVGQVISQETSQLVDALANLNIDQQENEKRVTHMSLDANLAKAQASDQAHLISNLKDELASTKNKREQAEAEVAKLMQDLRDLSATKGKDTSSDSDDIIKVGESASSPRIKPTDMRLKSLESTVKHLEDQVNNRRSLWVMKHSDPQSVARAIETLADSVQDNKLVHKTLMSIRPSEQIKSGAEMREQTEVSHQSMPSPRAASSFQPPSRPMTVGPPPPPKFGPIAAGPPRAPSVVPAYRHYPGAWGPTPSSSRAVSASNALVQTPPSNRGPPRKGFQNTSRYRPGVPEFQPAAYGYPESGPSRPPSSFGNRREFYPQTPSTGPRGRHGRFQDFSSTTVAEYGPLPDASNTMVNRSSSVGPLIHMSERTVGAWHGRIMEFYAVIRRFVERHAGLPQDGVSERLSRSVLWPVLLGTYHPLLEGEAASYVDYHLRNENSKACLVTRVVIDYVVNNVWVPTAWTGMDDETSYELQRLQDEFARTSGMSHRANPKSLITENFQGQSCVVRQPLLDRQARVLDSIMKRDREQVTDFYKAKIGEITGTLLSNLQPVMNAPTNPSEAYRDLEAVAESAWELSSSILTSRLTFDFRFPEIGCRFSAQSMLPIWPNTDPLELQSKHWRVAMVTTPVITCRNDTGTNISAHSVALADVFCMQ